MKFTYTLVAILGVAMTGCSHDSGKAAAPTLIHSPALSKMTPHQIQVLAVTCESYAQENNARGPYDAAYCGQAIKAWANVPLQAARMAPAPLFVDAKQH